MQVSGVLPIFWAVSVTMRAVSSLVAYPRMTSTSAISGTGFMKCIPMNRSGRPEAEASAVMGMEEVLLARMPSGWTICPSCSNRAFLTA